MTYFKIFGVALAGVVVGLLLSGAQESNLSGLYNNVAVDFSQGITVDGDQVLNGNGVYVGPASEPYEAVVSSNTLVVTESNLTSYLGTGGTTTLPAVALSEGTVFRFTIAAALTASTSIVSAEGDNIEGSLIVAGAVVDCDAVDEIRFVDNGENLGDFVELRSDGVKWFITSSNALTSAKLTCSG